MLNTIIFDYITKTIRNRNSINNIFFSSHSYKVLINKLLIFLQTFKYYYLYNLIQIKFWDI